MVETAKDCILQWAGHAGYITERFSGLLARQALVDVTLICEEQKLRVHKLVLASNSIYFEEILQQDLGQEPIIFLKDLDFGILKAMVEFMYCGQTTISHQQLSSLQFAAKIFKVKELVSVIDNIISSKKFLDNFENYLKQRRNSCSLELTSNSLTESDYVRVSCDKLSMDENISVCPNNNNDISSSNQSLEMIESTEHELEHTLYEESDKIDVNKKDIDTSFPTSNVNISMQSDTTGTVSSHNRINEVQAICTPSNNESYCNSYNLKPILYEQCCDLANINERNETSTTLSQSCLSQVESDLEHCSNTSTDVPTNAEKFVKVYTHKRRKSIDNVRNKFVYTHNLVPTLSSTDCIDLLDEPSSNIPVTLLTSLDIESAEYILSLSTETIQSIVGSNINEKHTVIGYKDNTEVEQDARVKEQLNSPNNTNSAKPILRRSMRLNQQDNDETVSNNSSRISNTTEKSFKKYNSSNGTESCAKARRKGKDDHKVPDQNINGAVQTKKNFNNKRNNSKLIVKKNIKSALTGNKDKEEQKPRVNNKFKTENMRRLTSVKRDIKEYIDRALWGDMSDTLDERESEINLLTYTSNTEIPFAVGLLPLRTALEKMQATPDYQPRKTRSSVAPMKQDISNLKRKSFSSFHNEISSKKQHNNNNESPNTVCHIQIRTAPSQYVKHRKRFLPHPVTNLAATDITNRQ